MSTILQKKIWVISNNSHLQLQKYTLYLLQLLITLATHLTVYNVLFMLVFLLSVKFIYCFTHTLYLNCTMYIYTVIQFACNTLHTTFYSKFSE